MIELYTAATPNGYKVSIMLEETGLPYKFHHVQLQEQEQKQGWYLRLNPNGRIPTIVDFDNDGFVVFESGAILIYLAEKTDQFWPHECKRHSQVLQWLMFQVAGIGPMQGQAHVFYRYAPERIPYAIQRYQNETLRLYRVLDNRLKDHEYLVDDISIADIATYPWVRSYKWAGVPIDELEHLQRWLGAMRSRPGVQRGLDVPVKRDRIKTQTVDEKTQFGRSMI